MSDSNSGIDEVPQVGRIIFFGSIAALAVAALVGVWLVFNFVEDEKERDLHAWQVRLNIVADTRVAAVNQWVDDQFATMRELVENESLQIYMSEIAEVRAGEGDPEAADAEVGYLRNLLVATANRNGFVAPVEAIEVDANVERAGIAGLAVTDENGNILVATPDMPPSTPQIREAIGRASGGEAVLIDIHAGAGNQPVIGFVLPVYGIQDDPGTAKHLGLVIGLKPLGKGFYGLLEQPGEIEETAENYLVRLTGAAIEYLTPLADGSPPLRRKLARDTPELAAAYAIDTPEGFAIKRDYAGDEVLATGRQVSAAPWYLVRKISREEALADTERRGTAMLTVFILIIVGIAITIGLVWFYGSSLRAAQAAAKFRISSERFENIMKFLNVVTDGQPAAIAAVDGETQYTFANKAAADQAGIAKEDMLGKTMASVIGPVKAKFYERINRDVLGDFQRATEVHETEEDGELQVVKSEHIPLRGDRDHPPGVLMVMEDITELTRERIRREQILKQLVGTLVAVVDRRDPFSADHSHRVADVSKAIAGEMGLDTVQVETVEIVSHLMNLGKILVPEALLTKTGDLTEEERAIIRDSILGSADLLEGVAFDGPVVPTIRHIHENWDGSGPEGLEGENIEVGARVVSVANAFAGMTSARAWRDAMPFDQAYNILMSEADAKFDRRAVSALINYIENRGGKDEWRHFADRPAGADGSA